MERRRAMAQKIARKSNKNISVYISCPWNTKYKLTFAGHLCSVEIMKTVLLKNGPYIEHAISSKLCASNCHNAAAFLFNFK